jgi:hypothetical protein
MSQSFCICVVITNNPITVILSQQALPVNDNSKNKVTVAVCIGYSRLSRAQSSRNTGSGESIARQRAETPEKEMGDKKEKKILCAFCLCVCVCVCVCVRGESKMGMSRLLVFVFLLRNKAEYSYIGTAAFTKRSRCDLLGYDAVYSGW